MKPSLSPGRRSSEPLARVTQLDGLRGFAFLVVFVVHLNLPSGLPEAHPWIERLKELGWIGVPLFFTLSGYLITELALREGPAFSLRRFYARRALRLWPLYFTVVVLGLLAWQVPQLRELRLAASPHWAVPLCTFTMNTALSGNPEGARSAGALIPLWTLCVEMQFYLFWAVVLRYSSRRWALVFCLAILLASLVARFVVPLDRYFLFYRMHTVVNCVPIMIGAALALLNAKRWRLSETTSNVGLAGAVIAGLILAYLEWPFPTHTWSGALLLIAADTLCLMLLLLTLCGAGFLRTVFESRPMRRAGTLSYAGYVFHLPVLWSYYPMKEALLGGSSWRLPNTVSVALDAAVCLTITLICASLWHSLERPLRRARAELRMPQARDLSPAGAP